jgi:hypothetical protein
MPCGKESKVKVSIDVEIPAWGSKSTPRESQVHRNRVSEILKLIGSRISNGGAESIDIDYQGAKASMVVAPSTNARSAA